VRSTRNVIYVEAERVAGAAIVPTAAAPVTAPVAPAVAPAATTAPTAAPTGKPAAATAANAAAVSFTGPSPAIRDLRIQKRGEATAVSLLGTSRLIATSVIEPKDGPRRVWVNLPNVTSSLPTTTNVGQGPVQRVRIGFDPKAPLMTQVTFELSRT